MDSTQLDLRTTGFAPADDSGSGGMSGGIGRDDSLWNETADALAAEGPARKIGRFQKSTAENEKPNRRQIGGYGSVNTGVDSKSTLANRRRSTVREHKAPSGPRPLDPSNSKRQVYSFTVS